MRWRNGLAWPIPPIAPGSVGRAVPSRITGVAWCGTSQHLPHLTRTSLHNCTTSLMMARRRLAETGRWRNSTRRWKPLSSLSDSYKTITFSFSSCYKNSYFFFLFCGFQPAGILSGGTMSGCGFESRPWRNSSPNTRPCAGSCRRSLDGETAKPVTTFWVRILLFLQNLLCFCYIRGRNGRRGFKSHRRLHLSKSREGYQ